MIVRGGEGLERTAAREHAAGRARRRRPASPCPIAVAWATLGRPTRATLTTLAPPAHEVDGHRVAERPAPTASRSRRSRTPARAAASAPARGRRGGPAPSSARLTSRRPSRYGPSGVRSTQPALLERAEQPRGGAGVDRDPARQLVDPEAGRVLGQHVEDRERARHGADGPPGRRVASRLGSASIAHSAAECCHDARRARLASSAMADIAGIVLAGGRSSRMGTPKAALEWHGSTLLRRVIGIVGRAVDGPVADRARARPAAAAAAVAGVEIVEDAREGRGPLQGLAAGLVARSTIAPRRSFLSSTDVPFLHPAFVRRVIAALDADTDVVLPRARGLPAAARRRLPHLAAAARLRSCWPPTACARPSCSRPAGSSGSTRTRCSPTARVARHDPRLESVVNLNEPGRLRGRAHARGARGARPPLRCAAGAGPARRPGRPRRHARRGGRGGRAALDEHVVAALNGDQISRDPELPLAGGDEVAFMAADAGG